MLSPADLLEIAEKFAGRIPAETSYDEERNNSWHAIGSAWVHCGDIARAIDALGRLDATRRQAQLRMAISGWVAEHPDSDAGRALIRETAARIDFWEDWLHRREITDFVPALYLTAGTEAVRDAVSKLKDPFTAGNALVRLADRVVVSSLRRELLESAERIALRVRPGDREFALAWVFRGYERGGLSEDAERVRAAMNGHPELTEPIRRSDEVLAQADALLRLHEPPREQDIAVKRLRRFLDYRMNDLKVHFLADIAKSGGVDDPEIESILAAEPFQRIEFSRPLSIDDDPSHLDDASFASFFFQRPVPKHDSDRELVEGADSFKNGVTDPQAFLHRTTRMFRAFGDLGPRFSMEQIEYGLWNLLGCPFSLGERLRDNAIAPAEREQCITAMMVPFRHYYATVADQFQGTAFFMWWDLILGVPSELQGAALEVLRQISELPQRKCQTAALHGLNQMYPIPEALAIVDQYLQENRNAMSEEEIAWVESCREGRAQ
jgi:hypothetical protein